MGQPCEGILGDIGGNVMWSIIENLLSEMRQKTIEEYYADFARLEGWLRDQERLLTPKKDHRNTIVNLCENLTLELYTYPAWMKIHLLSFCMKCSEERKYAEWRITMRWVNTTNIFCTGR